MSADRPGFTFHVENHGPATLRAPFGCGSAQPITLLASDGEHTLTPFTAKLDFAEAPDCYDVYRGAADCAGPFSDCGPGSGAYLAPGGSLDIAWDRRMWSVVDVTAWCSKVKSACSQCFLSQPVQGTAQGRLTLCDDGPFRSEQPGGAACTQSARVVDFSFDSAADGVTVVAD